MSEKTIITATTRLEQHACLHQLIAEMTRIEILYSLGKVSEATVREVNKTCIASLIVSFSTQAAQEGYVAELEAEITSMLRSLVAKQSTTTVH